MQRIVVDEEVEDVPPRFAEHHPSRIKLLGVHLTRDEVFARDEWRCVYCGEVWPVAQLSMDHVHPQSKGGDHSSGNVVTACLACNAKKGARTLSRFLAEDPEALAHFEALAVHVWPRHRTAVLEAARRPPEYRPKR